jgi:hypothetical protein
MKVWEALELLQGLDKTLEVTLVFGGTLVPPKFNTPMPAPQYPVWLHKETTFPQYTVTCKTVQ